VAEDEGSGPDVAERHFAPSGYISVFDAARKAWAALHPNDPGTPQDGPQFEGALRRLRETRNLLRATLGADELTAEVESTDGRRRAIPSSYWRDDSGALTIDTGLLEPRRADNLPPTFMHQVCFVPRDAFAAWLDRQRRHGTAEPPVLSEPSPVPKPGTKLRLPVTELIAELRRRTEAGSIELTWPREAEELSRWAKTALPGRPCAANTIRMRKELSAEYRRLIGKHRD
jgi:hypothetical protein